MHIVYYRECLEPNTGCCNNANQIHRHCFCTFLADHNYGETYCFDKCNHDLNCRGYMKRERNTDRYCGIVTTEDCTVFRNTTYGISCFEREKDNLGDLLPNSTCTIDFWSGCHIKYGKLRIYFHL